MMEKIDLSKAQAGWTAHFRCGGSAVIEQFQMINGAGLFPCCLKFSGAKEGANYSPEGFWQFCIGSPFDIIRLEPPAFDWKDVKPGMAFRCTRGEMNGQLYRWVGMTPHCKHDVYEREFNQSNYEITWLPRRDQMTRAPEYDIQVQS